MKNFYKFILVLLCLISFNLNAQVAVYFDPTALEATLGVNDSAIVHTVLHNATETCC